MIAFLVSHQCFADGGLVGDQASFGLGLKGLYYLEGAHCAGVGHYFDLHTDTHDRRALHIAMHIACHNFRHRQQAFQLQDLPFCFGLFVLSVFVGAAFADITGFLSFMDIIGDLFAFDRAQVFQAFLLFRKALRSQMIHFLFRPRLRCITLSTNTHKLLLPGVKGTDVYTPMKKPYLDMKQIIRSEAAHVKCLQHLFYTTRKLVRNTRFCVETRLLVPISAPSIASTSHRGLWIARGQATHTEQRGTTYLAGSLHRDASVLHSYFMRVYYTSFYFAFHAISFKPGFDGTIGLLARPVCHVWRAACLPCLPCLPTPTITRRGSRGHRGDGGLRNSRLLLRLRAPL